MLAQHINKMIRLDIETDYRTRTVKFWLSDERGNDFVNLNDVDGKIEPTEIKPFELNNNLKPLLTLPLGISEQFVKHIQDFANSTITKEPETKTAGKLEAKENHLEDMRKIAFKFLNIEP